MAKIVEQIFMIRVSKLVKNGAEVDAPLVTKDFQQSVNDVAESLLETESVVVEVEEIRVSDEA